MKDSLKKFYEYLGSDNELMTYVRLNGEWNEEAFCEMKKLVKEVMEEMEKRGFTFEESDALANKLSLELEKNSERFAKEKPFAVFKYENEELRFTSGNNAM